VDESLTDLCGGQFAVVPGHVIDDASISDGALRLYALYCSRADTNGYGRLSNSRAANILKVCEKTISNRRRDLERVGLLEVTGTAKYRIIRLPEQRAPAMAKAAKRAVKNAPIAHYGKKGADCKQAKNTSPKEGKNLHPKTEEIFVEEAKDSSPTHNQFKNLFSRGGMPAPLASPLEWRLVDRQGRSQSQTGRNHKNSFSPVSPYLLGRKV